MEDNGSEQAEMKKQSINKQVKSFGLNRLRKLGYDEKTCRSLLAKSFAELKAAWINHYGQVQ